MTFNTKIRNLSDPSECPPPLRCLRGSCSKDGAPVETKPTVAELDLSGLDEWESFAPTARQTRQPEGAC